MSPSKQMQLSELREKEIHKHAALYLASPECCKHQDDVLGAIWV